MLIVFVRAVKNNLANEGLEARKKEEEVESKKRKADNDKVWEGAHRLLSYKPCILTPWDLDNREQRVDSWRSFANSGKKKKQKTKAVLLG